MITLKVNNKDYAVDVHPDTPLLWVLRENRGLTGTKFGRGKRHFQRYRKNASGGCPSEPRI